MQRRVDQARNEGDDDDSSSSSEDEEEAHHVVNDPVMRDVGNAHCKFQGSFLSNLAKMLNEAHVTGLDYCIKWHPKLCNALQVDWPRVEERYAQLCPILVRYKISRANNSLQCARASWNRKLREWEFEMISMGSDWVIYVYKDANFARGTQFYDLPMARRK